MTPAAPDLEARYTAWAETALARWLPRESPQFPGSLAWVQSRFREGVALATQIAGSSGPPLVLDLGAGNGGVSLGLAAAGARVVALDCYLNGEVAELRAALGFPFSHVIAHGARLPFPDRALDAVILSDVIEHVDTPRVLGAEVARVLRPGGTCIITTPPRLRFLFAPDPHFGIPWLALLPAAGQKLVAERLLRRTEKYDVHHLYASAAGVARIFPTGAFALERQGGRPPLARLGLDWDRLVARRLA